MRFRFGYIGCFHWPAPDLGQIILAFDLELVRLTVHRCPAEEELLGLDDDISVAADTEHRGEIT
jgi:hypothetical protein